MNRKRPLPIETTGHRPRWTPRLSLVVPTYNVAPYIEEFLQSVFAQSSRTQRFEVIIVDDGSTDGSDKIALAWAKKHPAHIRYIRQDNHGLSEARNTGLAAARGTWVSFPDPDDFLDIDYFRIILDQLVIVHDKPLLMAVTKLLPYNEASGASMDNHPLNYRFEGGLTYVDTSEMGDFIHLSAASCWFERATLLQHKLRFNPRVQPVFEDGHLISKLLMLCPDRTIAVVPKAVYNYRKRADKSSLVMSAKAQRGFYLDTLEYGCFDLMLFAKAKLGHVPRFVQRICLYELQSRIRHLVGNDAGASILTQAEQAKFMRLLDMIFEEIDLEVIQSFQIGRFNNQHRLGLIGRFKPEAVQYDLLYIEKYDPVTRMARFSYFVTGSSKEDIRLVSEGRVLEIQDQYADATSFLGENYLVQNWFYVQLPEAGTVTCYTGDTKMSVRHIKRNLPAPLSHDALKLFLKPPAPKHLSDDGDTLRKDIIARPRTYDGSWLLMGTSMCAGDDAIALYRHLQTTKHANNIWLILSILSPDWAPLMQAGFRLLPYGRTAHLTALVQANLLITSCIEPDQHWPTDARLFADQTTLRTVILPQEFLPPAQVGDYLCVPSQLAADSLLLDTKRRPHRFPTEIMTTGFPRHDALQSQDADPKMVVFAPDWLRDMCSESGDNPFTSNPFKATDITAYKAFWEALFASQNLPEAKEAQMLEFRVVAGRNMAHELNIYDYLDDVIVHEPGEQEPLNNGVLAQAGLVITDQPKVAFDAAYIGCQSLLWCPNTMDIKDPMPDLIHVHRSSDTILAQIADHFSTQSTVTAPSAYFPDDPTTSVTRIQAALEKLS